AQREIVPLLSVLTSDLPSGAMATAVIASGIGGYSATAVPALLSKRRRTLSPPPAARRTLSAAKARDAGAGAGIDLTTAPSAGLRTATVLSSDPLATFAPSGETAILVTGPPWAWAQAKDTGAARSVLSAEAVMMVALSPPIATPVRAPT